MSSTKGKLGRPVTLAETRDFRNYVAKCGLQELKTTDSFYTWNNEQEGESKVYSKIDKVLVNDKYRQSTGK